MAGHETLSITIKTENEVKALTFSDALVTEAMPDLTPQQRAERVLNWQKRAMATTLQAVRADEESIIEFVEDNTTEAD